MNGTVAPCSRSFRVASTRDGDAPTELLILWRTSVLTMMRPQLFHNSAWLSQLNPMALTIGVDPGKNGLHQLTIFRGIILRLTICHQRCGAVALNLLQDGVLVLHQR